LQILRGIAAKYPNLFGIGSEPGDGEHEGVDGEIQTFRTKWGWIASINDICKDDRTKWDYFFKMNVIEFLNTMTFYKDKSENDKEIWTRQQQQR
jgi:hypothetical protein